MRAVFPVCRSAHRLQFLSCKRSTSVNPKVLPRKHYIVAARGQGPEDSKPVRKDAEEGPVQTALRSASSVWSRLDTQQRVYTFIAGAALLAAAPQLLTFLVIAVERLLVGLLLAVEELLAGALLLGTRLIVLLGSLAFLAVGAYLFLVKKDSSTS